MSDIQISVVIVSFQVCELLDRCLASILTAQNSPRMQIIVVDNASTDGSPEMVRTKYPSVQLIANSENLGFARANNVGLKYAQGRYWMLLNPDTQVTTEINPFQILIDFMDQHPRAGACGASLFYADGARQHSAFRFPSLAQVYMDLFPAHWRLRESRLNGRYPLAQYERGEPFQIDHPLGAALLVRPEAANQVGWLDEDYFIYAEEVDWCIRLKRAGWEVWCVPQARFIHHEARSTRQFREQMFVELWKARFTLFRKNYSRAFNAAVRPLVRRGMDRATRDAEAKAARGEMTQAELTKRITAYRQVTALSRGVE